MAIAYELAQVVSQDEPLPWPQEELSKMSRNVKSRFNPHVIRAQKEVADQQRREDEQKRRDEELKEALHKKKLREAGYQSAISNLPVTTSVIQDNLSSQTRPTLALSPSSPQASSTIQIPISQFSSTTAHTESNNRQIKNMKLPETKFADRQLNEEDQVVFEHTKPINQPQLAEPVSYNKSKYQFDLPKDGFLDKKVTAGLPTRECNIQQATFNQQSQGRHSEETEKSEDLRLRDASTNREHNSRINHQYSGFTTTANDSRLSNSRSNNHYNPTNPERHYDPIYHHSQQTTQPVSQPELQQLVPAYERSRAGPPSDRRMLTELAKVYTSDNMKYSGDMFDPLDSKLYIFEDWCNKLNIIGDDRDHAFSIILKGRAQEYYYAQCIGLSLNSMIRSMKNHFETLDVRQGVQARWNTMSLYQIRTENPSKSKMEQLMLLIDELEKLQRVLPANLRDARTLQDRLVSACRGIQECDYALQILHASYEGLVAALRQSIATAEANERTNMSQRFNYDSSNVIKMREKEIQLQKHDENTQYVEDHDHEGSSHNENRTYYTNRIYKGGRDWTILFALFAGKEVIDLPIQDILTLNVRSNMNIGRKLNGVDTNHEATITHS
ncbi:hypothetical protein GcC1_187032 [Golovinomyces cichoracearum]|uniref:Integrase and RNaseH domain-containing protein n=1 Tax=Golovinomyces cichoracearum TaxID=62708 RepID=A0A420HJX0_9PEZI|nr:hypothetical protein GcC1_187032 [Golovinomyces cichoracearum]